MLARFGILVSLLAVIAGCGAHASIDRQSPEPPTTVPTRRVVVGDLLRVSITDLVGQGIETVKETRVSKDGKIDLPLVGEVAVAGLTEAEAERSISAAYKKADLIEKAQVSVEIVPKK